jgi:hypothetical protein
MKNLLTVARERLSLLARVGAFVACGAIWACGVGVLAAAATGCTAASLAPDTQASIAQLEAELVTAKADGDLARAAELETGIAQLEADGAAQSVRSVFGLFGLSGIIPGGALIENVIAAGAWLAFKRPRRLVAKTLKDPRYIGKAIGAAVGVLDSRPDPDAPPPG